jgi:hypothetical protein
MGTLTAVASIAIYATGPKASVADARDSDGFGGPVAPAPISAPRPAARADAPPSVNVPPVRSNLVDARVDGMVLQSLETAKGASTIVSDPTTPNAEKRYLHAVIKQIDPAQFWDVQILRDAQVDVPAGQDLVLQLVARSATKNPVEVGFIRAGADYHADLSQKLTLTPNWKTYTVPFKASRTYLHATAGEGASVCLHCGQRIGTIDVAALQAFPPDKVADAK